MFLDLCHTAAFAAPSILGDSRLKVDSVTSGLSSPTSMAFIDDKNINTVYSLLFIMIIEF